jgi:hypothetical protein
MITARLSTPTSRPIMAASGAHPNRFFLGATTWLGGISTCGVPGGGTGAYPGGCIGGSGGWVIWRPRSASRRQTGATQLRRERICQEPVVGSILTTSRPGDGSWNGSIPGLLVR